MLGKSSDLGPNTVDRGTPTLRRNAWRVAAAGVSVAALVSLAACSSSSGKASSSDSASSSGSGANVAAAQAAITPFLVAPTTFPATDPLPSKLPAGKSFVFLQCGTPICAVTSKLTAGAVQAIGGKMTVVSVGNTAQTAQAGASSALALKPDAVILGAIDPSLFGTGLKALADAGVKLVSLQIDKDVTPFGITFNYLGADLSKQNGKLMADWVIVNKGAHANAVLYTLPALDLSAPLQAAFEAEMKTNCSTCKVRVVPLDVASLGTTAPRTIVTDLQAHPDTNAAAFVSLSAATGLPAALDTAGLSVSTIGFGPTAGNLQDVKDGKITAALATSFPVSTWTSVDIAARLIEGAQPTAGEKTGQVPAQILEQKDITFDPSHGWLGFPDFAQRFAVLWHTTS